MPGNLTENEKAFKKSWSHAYKTQEHLPGGYDDFGEFSAHVALSYRQEIVRLRTILQQHGIDSGEWADPVFET